jgi:hypothetical protein
MTAVLAIRLVPQNQSHFRLPLPLSGSGKSITIAHDQANVLGCALSFVFPLGRPRKNNANPVLLFAFAPIIIGM